jgi:hypothetical protein
MRRLGDITLDLEPILEEMIYDHDLQHGEVLNIVRGWLEIHAPDSKEVYLDGTSPIFYYGPEEEEWLD